MLRRALGLCIGVLALTACASQAAPIEPTPTPSLNPQLILVQVLDREEYAVGNGLMDAQAGASSIAYVPSSLLVPIVDGAVPPRLVTLGATPSEPDTLTPKTSVEAAFELTLDGSWTLDLLAFAGLVDAVGGVIVEVPQAIVLAGPRDAQDIVISAGRQRLGGVAAAEYATSAIPGGYPVDQLTRFRDVWVSVLARLPESPERLRQILTSLGFLARTTATIETLLDVLGAGREAVLTRTFVEELIGVDVIRGGERPASVLTPEGSRTVATMFAAFTAPAALDDTSSEGAS